MLHPVSANEATDETHASLLDGFVEQLDDVHSFHSAGLEALRPGYQKALQARDRYDALWTGLCYNNVNELPVTRHLNKRQ